MAYLSLIGSLPSDVLDSVYLAGGIALCRRPKNPGRLLLQVELGHACLSGLGLPAPSHVLQHVVSAHASNYMFKKALTCCGIALGIMP